MKKVPLLLNDRREHLKRKRVGSTVSYFRINLIKYWNLTIKIRYDVKSRRTEKIEVRGQNVK